MRGQIWNFPLILFSVELYPANGDQNQYKIVVPLFGALFAKTIVLETVTESLRNP